MNRVIPALLMLAASFALLAPSAYAKSVFDADPGQRGLLVADLRLRHKTLFQLAEADLQHGVVVRLDVPAPSVEGGDAVSKVLVFAVEAGQWRLAGALASLRLGTSVLDFDVRFPPDSLPELTQWVKNGEVVYMGRVESKSVPHLSGRAEFHSSVSYDREREIQILQKLQGKAKKSPWAGRFASRVVMLKTGTPEVSAPPDSTGH